MNGWAGLIARVNLSTGRVRVEELNPSLARAYLGGRGLGTRLVADSVDPSGDPLAPDNILVFAAGPLTGTRTPTAGRLSLSTRSPLTGAIHDSSAGGGWGAGLRHAGWDALVVEGRAASPVYLIVHGQRIEIADATPLWGMDTRQATARLLEAAPAGSNALCIGPAGENLVRIAAVIVDGRRAAARGGVGAVMGSKNLKGIVVRGEGTVPLADPDRFKAVLYEAQKQLKANPLTSKALPQFGTAVLVNLMNELGFLPARNFQESCFPGADRISGEAMAEDLLVRRRSCYGCPIGCTRVIRGTQGVTEGPEYETIWALGADCGVDDLAAIAELNLLCNRLGLDTISMGGTLACAMELSERGFLDEPVRFGDAAAMARLIEDTAYRRGLGDRLAEGARRFAAALGGAEYAMQVKGLELPAYDPRGMRGQGLAYATSNRGGCHLRGNMLGPEVLGVPKMIDPAMVTGKAGFLVVLQNSYAVEDSLVVCKFAGFALTGEYYARLLSAATGEDYTSQDLQIIGERIWNLERLYNQRAGFTRGDDTLPPRLLDRGPDGRPVLDAMLDEYYRARGWTAEGIPTDKKLKQLGLVGGGPDA